MTREQDQANARRWIAQWRSASDELAEQKRRELAAMTDEEAMAISEMLLAMADPATLPPERWTYSGLVEQQRIFHRRRSE
ncbi:MAG: hypothetical protein U0821_23020 [Chloroflexota bacterium]